MTTYRSKFERELNDLHSKILELGDEIVQSITLSLEALVTQNKELAESVINNDKDIKSMTDGVESAALKILLRQQPIASDLRVISTALKMVTDMERIGVQSRDICAIVLHLCEEEYQTKLIRIPKMAEIVKIMVTLCIESFVSLDINLAKKVISMDQDVDDLFLSVKDNLIKMIRENPQYADQAIYLMMVAKYLEKIGDHAENIAEWVIFCKTGEKKQVKLI